MGTKGKQEGIEQQNKNTSRTASKKTPIYVSTLLKQFMTFDTVRNMVNSISRLSDKRI